LSDSERQRAVEDADGGGIFPLAEKAVSPWR